jgi:hypothetical protein
VSVDLPIVVVDGISAVVSVGESVVVRGGDEVTNSGAEVVTREVVFATAVGVGAKVVVQLVHRTGHSACTISARAALEHALGK